MFKVEIVADSIGFMCPRLTTMALTYPRFIHAELMTYRTLSRNASSSRAIPVKTMLDNIRRDPAMPVWWGKNQPGMQAREELESDQKTEAQLAWLNARDEAVKWANKLSDLGLHKQITNRILEPWMLITTLVTSTVWDNLYAQRIDPDAQPEFKALAELMLKAHNESVPKVLAKGQWHLPYIRPEEYAIPTTDTYFLQKISAARCARVSYLNHDKSVPVIERDLELYQSLMTKDIKHASPTEHQAMAGTYDNDISEINADLGFELSTDQLSGNLGACWIQFRKLHKKENIETYRPLKRYAVDGDGKLQEVQEEGS